MSAVLSSPEIIWLTPQELAERRLAAEINRQVAHGQRCTDPRGLEALMDKYLERKFTAGPCRRGTGGFGHGLNTD